MQITRKIIKTGDARGITIPKAILDALKWEVGDIIIVELKERVVHDGVEEKV